MKTFNHTLRSILSAVLLTLACLSSCEQVPLYDTAKNGVPMIYGLSDNGVDGLLVVAGGDYYAEFTIGGYGIPAASEILHVNGRLRVFIARANQIYTHDGERYNSSWSPYSLPYTIYSLDSCGSNTYIAVDSTGDCLYRWDEDGKTAVSLGKTAGDAPRVVRYEPALGALFVAGEQGGNTPVYVVTDAAALQLVVLTLAGLPRLFLRVYGSNVYVGRENGIYLNGIIGAYFTGIGIQSYAAYGETVCYAAGLSGTLFISRLEGTAFVTDYTFASAGGDIEIAVLDDDHLAVGIANSLSDNGLYIYHRSKKSLNKISSRSMYSLYVR